MMPLKGTKDKVSGHSSSAESLVSLGGETSVVASVMIGGTLCYFLC